MVVLYKPKYYIHIILHGKLIFKDFNCIPNLSFILEMRLFLKLMTLATKAIL